MQLSICIPTYNRAAHLANCLQSIISNKSRLAIDFQVCVSDNCSTDGTEKAVRSAQRNIAIKDGNHGYKLQLIVFTAMD